MRNNVINIVYDGLPGQFADRFQRSVGTMSRSSSQPLPSASQPNRGPESSSLVLGQDDLDLLVVRSAQCLA